MIILITAWLASEEFGLGVSLGKCFPKLSIS